MTPEIGDWDIYIRDNDNFDPETDYKPVVDGKGRNPWPIEIIVNDRRQRWQPEIRRKIPLA